MHQFFVFFGVFLALTEDKETKQAYMDKTSLLENKIRRFGSFMREINSAHCQQRLPILAGKKIHCIQNTQCSSLWSQHISL